MRRVSGLTYMTVLFTVAIISGGLALLGQAWHTAAMRDKEAELLHVGNEYRKAIERYYTRGQAQYPRSLSDLLKDPRAPGTERYLRRLYPDPVTGKEEWGLVKGLDGGIMGVYSLSEGKPFKTNNFRSRDKQFSGAEKYSEWKFVFAPLQQSASQAVLGPPAVHRPESARP